jgi:Protein of unknown function (DUF2794)
MSEVVSFDEYHSSARRGPSNRPGGSKHVFFDRREFQLILGLYAHMVGQGEWRDYAIGHDQRSCSFAVFRRSADGALYRIVKTPHLARKQGAYAVLGAGERVLKRGQSLAAALKVFQRKRLSLV